MLSTSQHLPQSFKRENCNPAAANLQSSEKSSMFSFWRRPSADIIRCQMAFLLVCLMKSLNYADGCQYPHTMTSSTKSHFAFRTDVVFYQVENNSALNLNLQVKYTESRASCRRCCEHGTIPIFIKRYNRIVLSHLYSHLEGPLFREGAEWRCYASPVSSSAVGFHFLEQRGEGHRGLERLKHPSMICLNGPTQSPVAFIVFLMKERTILSGACFCEFLSF